jgi:hypothetical protein
MLEKRCCYLVVLIFIELARPHAVSCFAVRSQWDRQYMGRFHDRLTVPIVRPYLANTNEDPFRSEILRIEERNNNTESSEIAEIVVHKVKETVSHTGVIATLHIIVERFVEGMERFSERTLERVTERSLQRSAKRSWERVGERALEQVGERTWERSGERVLDRVNERALERFGERMGERVGERSLERAGKRTLEQAGERTLERAGERTLNRFLEQRLLGLPLGRLVVRFGRGLAVALPLFGGLFSLYLFHGDIVRWYDERQKIKTFICMNWNETNRSQPELYSLSTSGAAALAFLLGTGIVDFLDAALHFWMAYGLLLAHNPHSAHDWRERGIWICAILSTIFAICGEIFSHQNSVARRNASS